MDERLRRCAHAGDINELYSCIREDGRVLKRMDMEDFVDTPLHIASARGHSDFAMAIMYLKPSFGRKLNQDICSPIHLALQNDHIETVLSLLAVDRDLVRVKGKDGYTALHYAVHAEGSENVDLLNKFLKDCPECVDDVTVRNETVLHIAAQNETLGALEVLVRWLQRTNLYGKISNAHLINSKDRDGNTVLHIAASKSQPKMIQLLVECKPDMTEINMSGLTALDILEEQEQDHNRDLCLDILHRKGALNASSVIHSVGISPYKRLRSKITFFEKAIMGLVAPIMRIPSETLNAIIFGITLVITAILEGMLNPPGGVWQGDISKDPTSPENARVGTSVMNPANYTFYTALIFALFHFVFFVIVAVIQTVTSSAVITIIAEIVGALLACSFGVATRVLVPQNAYLLIDIERVSLSRSLELKLQPLYFLAQIVVMEVIRRVCLICMRWYKEL